MYSFGYLNIIAPNNSNRSRLVFYLDRWQIFGTTCSLSNILKERVACYKLLVCIAVNALSYYSFCVAISDLGLFRWLSFRVGEGKPSALALHHTTLHTCEERDDGICYHLVYWIWLYIISEVQQQHIYCMEAGWNIVYTFFSSGEINQVSSSLGAYMWYSGGIYLRVRLTLVDILARCGFSLMQC